MSTDDRLDRLEHRLAELEELVRRLATPGAALPASPTPPAATFRTPPPEARRPDAPHGASPIATKPPAPRPGSTIAGAKPAPRDTEQWLGQRGLLAVGVLFVILAAGYLLKYSFEQGWVSPLMRCIGGTVSGAAIAVVGWRLLDKGMRTYGAALIGCGAAIFYLAVWAAVSLYQLFPPPGGIAALALESLGLAAIAYAIDIQALGATAVLGAFFAPILLGHEPSNANVLLLYLSSMAFTLGWVSARKRWRLAALLIALSYFGLGGITGAAEHAEPWLVLLFGVAGGSLGLHLGLRERWWETRFLSFTGGWELVAVASDRIGSPWLVMLAAIALAIPVWAHAIRTPLLWPLRLDGNVEEASIWSTGELLYFLATPVLLGWAIDLLDPGLFTREPGIVPLIVAVAYLARGYIGVHPEFALVGATAAGYAALVQWSGLGAVWALFGLSLLWAALDHPLKRTDGRWFALLSLAAGLTHLLTRDVHLRPAGTPAFADGWALALWAGIACLVLMARGLWRAGGNQVLSGSIRPACWTAAGTLLLFGVTWELDRFFLLRLAGDSAALWTGLAISVWWILFACGLVLLGFRNDLKIVRQAGLLVAAMAAVKILAHDLASLNALYRVGSVFITGLISLLLAYLYNRKAKEA